MNKNYITGALAAIVVVIFLVCFLNISGSKTVNTENSMIPRIGQKVWTYNMNGHKWTVYDNEKDIDSSKETIILQVQQPEGNVGYTSYRLITGNALVPKEDVWIGEGSQEFLKNGKLYSYFPKTFEFYEVVFNGVNFVPRKLSKKEVMNLFNNFEVIDVSKLEKGTFTINYKKNKNKFMILNDSGEDFYKYYIVPNDSKKMEIGEFSNQFTVKSGTNIKIQRLEGCSKAYPCYEININR